MQRRVVAGVAAAILVAGGVGAGVAALTGEDEPPVRRESSAAAQQPEDPPAPPLSAERANELTAALASGDETTLRSALALPTDQPLDPALSAGLAAAGMQIDVASFRATGSDAGQVAATTDGGARRWTVDLLLLDGTYRIAYTQEAS